MKRAIAVFVVIALLPIFAVAEEFNEQVLTGEWYIANSLYALAQFSAKAESNGDFSITDTNGANGILHSDGSLEQNGQIIGKMSFLRNNDDIILLHMNNNNDQSFLVLFPKEGNDYRGYTFSSLLALFVNGKKIDFNGGIEEYYIIGGKLYFVSDQGYNRGKITMYGTDCLYYDNETNYIESADEKPFMLLIKAESISEAASTAP